MLFICCFYAVSMLFICCFDFVEIYNEKLVFQQFSRKPTNFFNYIDFIHKLNLVDLQTQGKADVTLYHEHMHFPKDQRREVIPLRPLQRLRPTTYCAIEAHHTNSLPKSGVARLRFNLALPIPRFGGGARVSSATVLELNPLERICTALALLVRRGAKITHRTLPQGPSEFNRNRLDATR